MTNTESQLHWWLKSRMFQLSKNTAGRGKDWILFGNGSALVIVPEGIKIHPVKVPAISPWFYLPTSEFRTVLLKHEKYSQHFRLRWASFGTIFAKNFRDIWGGLIFIPPVLTVILVILVYRMELLEFNEKNNHLLAWRLSESKHSACKNPLCGTWRGNKGARKAHNLTPGSMRTASKMKRKITELTNFIQQITT